MRLMFHAGEIDSALKILSKDISLELELKEGWSILIDVNSDEDGDFECYHLHFNRDEIYSDGYREQLFTINGHLEISGEEGLKTFLEKFSREERTEAKEMEEFLKALS